MIDVKRILLEKIQQQSQVIQEQLVEEFAAADPGEVEAIAAGIVFEGWLAQACQESLKR